MGGPEGVRDAIAKETLSAFGAERLRALTRAVGDDRGREAFERLFERLVLPWGDRPIGERPRYASNVADDEAPYELSLALSEGGSEVQVYLDAQGEPPTPVSNLRAGRALLEAVARDLGAPLDRLRLVEPLFLPEEPGPPFALWIGASWAPGRAIKLKVYLNPAARGGGAASRALARAMERLGLSRAWSLVRAATRASDEAGIVCLDLAEGDDARVKVYFRHHRAAIADIAAFARLTGEHDAEQVATFYRILAGGDGPYLEKPALTQIAFVGKSPARPLATTLAFPIGKYVENDGVARARIERCFAAFGVPAGAYRRALPAFATRPLEERAGMHAHVTLRRLKSGPRIGVYFATEAYRAPVTTRPGGLGAPEGPSR